MPSEVYVVEMSVCLSVTHALPTTLVVQVKQSVRSVCVRVCVCLAYIHRAAKTTAVPYGRNKQEAQQMLRERDMLASR